MRKNTCRRKIAKLRNGGHLVLGGQCSERVALSVEEYIGADRQRTDSPLSQRFECSCEIALATCACDDKRNSNNARCLLHVSRYRLARMRLVSQRCLPWGPPRATAEAVSALL